MSHRPAAIDLIVEIDSEDYVLGTLSFNQNKEELSYYLIASENAPEQVLDLSSNTVGDQLHHVTWHSKCPHIRTKSKIVQSAVYPWAAPLTSGFPGARPLLVESVCLGNSVKLLRKVEAHEPWRCATQQVILRQNLIRDFSLVFILVPENLPTTDLFLGGYVTGDIGEKVPLWYLRADQYLPGRIAAFSNWHLVVFCTPYPRNIESIPFPFLTGYRLPDFISPVDSLFAICRRAKLAPMLSEAQVDALRCVAHQRVDQRISSAVLQIIDVERENGVKMEIGCSSPNYDTLTNKVL